MMTTAEHDAIFGTNDFQRMSVYAWDFYIKWQKKSEKASISKKNEIFENFIATSRIAYKIKKDLAESVPAITKDPYFSYLDDFFTIFFNNLPDLEFSVDQLDQFIDETDNFIFEYGPKKR